MSDTEYQDEILELESDNAHLTEALDREKLRSKYWDKTSVKLRARVKELEAENENQAGPEFEIPMDVAPRELLDKANRRIAALEVENVRLRVGARELAEKAKRDWRWEDMMTNKTVEHEQHNASVLAILVTLGLEDDDPRE